MSPRRVEVRLAERSYAVGVGRGVLGTLPATIRQLVGKGASRAMLVTDTGVPAPFADSLEEGLTNEGFAVHRAPVTPSESVKTMATVEKLLTEAARSGHTRIDPVIALGGGVVGDIAGFVAAAYQRGTPVIQCPTTLLSMVDASVGGKTGVNLAVEGELYKNLVGAFHQPMAVCAEIEVLTSLDPRHRRAGLAECVKHAMIGASVGGGEHAGLIDWTGDHLDAIRAFDPGTIEELVARNVALKAEVVMGDERESPEAVASGRMLLNFGHTFGHAIETLTGVSPEPDDPGLAPLHHGEAVALGMVAACAAGELLGLCEESVGKELRTLLEKIGLPVRVAGLPDTDELIGRMGHDKKAAGGELRVILPTGRGRCTIVRGPESSALAAGLDAIRA